MSTATEEKAHVEHATAKRYVISWLLLSVLTYITYAIAHADIGDWSLTVALLIAFFKGTVVALFFMHLKFERWRLRLIFIVPLPLAAILVFTVIMEHVR